MKLGKYSRDRDLTTSAIIVADILSRVLQSRNLLRCARVNYQLDQHGLPVRLRPRRPYRHRRFAQRAQSSNGDRCRSPFGGKLGALCWVDATIGRQCRRPYRWRDTHRLRSNLYTIGANTILRYVVHQPRPHRCDGPAKSRQPARGCSGAVDQPVLG